VIDGRFTFQCILMLSKGWLFVKTQNTPSLTEPMAWKILSALSALCLAGSAFFAWKNTEALKNERAREEYTNKNLTSIQEHKKAAEESKAKHTTDLAEANKELETTKASVADALTKATEKEQELAAVKIQLEGITKVVNDLQKQIDEAGDINALLATIATLEKEKKEAESKLANESQRLANAQETVNNLTNAAKAAEEREARGRKGIVEPDFTARVSQSFPQWGFVVLNKGNGGGVFANANLEVKRGQETIAKLRVRNVEQNGSVADLVPGSAAEGTSIRTGDLVVAAAEQAVTAPKTTTAPTAAPGAPAAPAPAAAPAASDPFGAPPAGGMAPAPASDPFGAPPAGGMAPAAPAAPAPASDPFGAAPAAPAAPATGTPAAPSTADPFGAAPPKP
jgi:hypothetical protein